MTLASYNDIIIRFLLAHVIGDFVFQSKRIVDTRNARNVIKRIRGNCIHCVIHLIILWILMLPFPFNKIIIPILISICIHFVLDYIKSTLISNNIISPDNIYIFLTDQILHLCVIFTIGYFTAIEIKCKNNILSILEFFFKDAYTIVLNILNNQTIITLTFLLLLATWGMGMFINIFLEYIQRKNQHGILVSSKIVLLCKKEKDTTDTGIVNGGFIIGLLERLLIIFSIVIGRAELIGFILAVKAVARLKKFDDDRFVEMFVIGSFISFIASIIIGEIILKMNIFHKFI